MTTNDSNDRVEYLGTGVWVKYDAHGISLSKREQDYGVRITISEVQLNAIIAIYQEMKEANDAK